MKFLKKLRLAYGDMKLSSKFTLVLMITATIPVIMMAGFFYGRLYDMVVSYTIRQEQDTSAQTAPYVEELMHMTELRSRNFFRHCSISLSTLLSACFLIQMPHRTFRHMQRNWLILT